MKTTYLEDATFKTHEQMAYAFWASKVFQPPLFQKKIKQAIKTNRHHFDACTDEMNVFLEANLGDLELDMQLQTIDRLTQKMVKNTSQGNLVFDDVLNKNLAELTKELDLNHTETNMIRFFVLLNGNKDLDTVFDYLGDINKNQVIEVLAWVLDIPKNQVSDALSKNSVLSESGILKIDTRYANELSDKVDLLNGLTDILTTKESLKSHFLDQFFRLSSPAELCQDNFPHLDKQFEYLESYLLRPLHD